MILFLSFNHLVDDFFYRLIIWSMILFYHFVDDFFVDDFFYHLIIWSMILFYHLIILSVTFDKWLDGRAR